MNQASVNHAIQAVHEERALVVEFLRRKARRWERDGGTSRAIFNALTELIVQIEEAEHYAPVPRRRR